MPPAGATTEVQPIDRLEEKIRQLVGMIDTLRAERAKAVDESARLTRELDATRAKLAEAGATSAEAAAMREERELVRNRVVQMLAQIDKLNI
jgi:regulator of replication initiation timing